jgi:hypothetical protein
VQWVKVMDANPAEYFSLNTNAFETADRSSKHAFLRMEI